jgi:hypothetical protein
MKSQTLTDKFNEPPEIPGHLRLFAEEIRPVTEKIRDAFIYRPSPSGRIIADFNEFRVVLNDWFNRLKASAQDMTLELNGPLSSALAKEDKEMISRSVASFENYIDEIITISHEIWGTAFPLEVADGQALLCAVPDRMLRECLAVFEEVAAIVENPGKMAKKHGSSTIRLDLVFDGIEINRFAEWLKERGLLIKRIRKAEGRKRFWNIAAAFLLGFWIGDD